LTERVKNLRAELKMLILSNLTTIALLLITHCGLRTSANHFGPFKVCHSCKDQLGIYRSPRYHDDASSTSVLAQGDLCGAPCHKLLNNVLRGLEPTIFQSDHDIYIPNCDTRGFYRKKQCRSSKGMQRGHCWCVDEVGAPLPLHGSEDGSLPCDG
ncbi:unnamed protein product, partial [Menidia menidia]